jgi:hypothetical protein
MNIRLDDATYKIFETAAATVSQNGIKIPVAQLAETIINAELAGMDPKKVARKFAKSLMNRLSRTEPEGEEEEEGETDEQ